MVRVFQSWCANYRRYCCCNCRITSSIGYSLSNCNIHGCFFSSTGVNLARYLADCRGKAVTVFTWLVTCLQVYCYWITPALVTLTVYSPESPGFTVCELGLTFRLMLGAAETGVAIIGNRATSIKLTRKKPFDLNEMRFLG